MNRLTTYDPFADVFPPLFRGFIQPVVRPESRGRDMRIDVTESNDSFTVHADMPGVEKDDINVEIDGNQVSISAQVNKSEVETAAGDSTDNARVLRTERYRGFVSRTFVLDSEIDEDAASASYENGVLALKLPKKVPEGARRLSIN